MAHSLPPQVEILAVSETNHFKAFLSLHLLLPLPFEIHPASSYYAQGAGMMGIAGGHGGDEEVESRATTSVWLPGGWIPTRELPSPDSFPLGRHQANGGPSTRNWFDQWNLQMEHSQLLVLGWFFSSGIGKG